VTAEARFDGEVQGASEAYVGGLLILVLVRPYAPGAPLQFTLGDVDAPLALTGRSAGSKRREDGRYTVRVRLTNLRRAERETLEAMHRT
jgi:hypothetical protein